MWTTSSSGCAGACGGATGGDAGQTATRCNHHGHPDGCTTTPAEAPCPFCVCTARVMYGGSMAPRLHPTPLHKTQDVTPRSPDSAETVPRCSAFDYRSLLFFVKRTGTFGSHPTLSTVSGRKTASYGSLTIFTVAKSSRHRLAATLGRFSSLPLFIRFGALRNIFLPQQKARTSFRKARFFAMVPGVFSAAGCR